MELKILEYLASHGGYALYIDILNAFPTASVTNGFLKILRRNHFIEAELRSGSSVRITDEGRARLEELQQQADERSQAKAEMRANQKRNDLFNKKQLIFDWVNSALVLLTLAATVYAIFH